MGLLLVDVSLTICTVRKRYTNYRKTYICRDTLQHTHSEQ